MIAAAGLAPSGIGYAFFAFVWIVGLVVDGATTNTILSQAVGPSDQGRTQGAARSLNSITGLFAPGAFSLILAFTIRSGGKPWSGTAYVISGILTLIGLAVAMHITRPATIGSAARGNAD